MPRLDPTHTGAPSELEVIYRRYADAVYTLALRITGSREDAEDVLQDVFVALPGALQSYREEGRFESWLKRVAARIALMRLRSKNRKQEKPLEEALLNGASSTNALEQIALERALQRLPEPLRAVFVLREIEGFTHAEIAELLNISAANSATRLSRAWAALRKDINP